MLFKMVSMLDLLGIIFLMTLISELIKAESDSSQMSSSDSLEYEYGIIQHASVIFRHGDRSPVSVYPLDPHKHYPWPQGFAQLTNEGKRRMYDIGKWLKLRYTKLIDQQYNREQIIVHSTDKDRCIMSAQCLLRGLYPATGSQAWLEKEEWQPIPVFSLPKDCDHIMDVRNTCSRIKNIIETCYSTPEFQKVFKKHINTIQYIQKHSGENLSNITAIDVMKKLRILATTLLIEHRHNLTLPDWTKQIYPQPLRTIVQEIIHLEAYHPVGKRLIVGPILKSITTDILQKTNDAKFQKNLHLYSGSDTILEQIMIALNIYNYMRPDFGSALIFELRGKGNDSFITISYKNSTDKEPFLLNTPVHSLEEFLKIAKPLIPQDWNEECQVSSSFSVEAVSSNNLYLILGAIIYVSFK